MKLSACACLLFLAAHFGTGCVRAADAPPQAVTFVLPQASVLFSEAYLAEDLGLWKKRGVDARIIVVTGVGSITAIISGSAEFGITSATSLLRAAAKGQRLLAIASVSDRSLIEIVLRRDIAAAAGFDPEEIRLAIMPVTSMRAALETRQIDGYAAAMPFPTMAVRAGTGVMVASGPDGEPADIVPLGFGLLVTRPETCEKRKMLCRAVAGAFADAAAFMKEHPAEALASMQRRFPEMSGDIVALVFDAVVKATPVPPLISRIYLENADRFNIESGLMDAADRLPSYDGLYTDEFVRGN